MREDTEQFSIETARRFLLGQLNPAEQTGFEERLLKDDRLEQRVRLAECDLTDEYALRRLSAVERRLFEERFLVTADRKRTLNVSRALRDRFAADSSEETTHPVRRLKSLFNLRQPAWRYAFGAVVLVILLATVWLVTKESRIRKELDAGKQPAKSASPAPSSQAQHPQGSPTPVHQETPVTALEHAPAGSVATVVLARDREGAPQLSLPQGEHDIVRLQLLIERNQPGNYRAELLNVDGQTVFGSESLKPSGSDPTRIDFDVPARLLKQGEYQVVLRRVTDGSAEDVSSYYFRVQ